MANATWLTEWALFAAEKADEKSPSILYMLWPFLIIGVLFWLLLIRPQRQEQAKRQAMLRAVKKNDRVVTAGGIYGVVTNVRPDADEVTVKVDETTNTKLRMTLSSVTRVVGDEPPDEKNSSK